MKAPLTTRLPAGAPVAAGVAALVGGSLALGAAVPGIVDVASEDARPILLPLGLAASIAVVAAGPVACLAAIAALSTAGIRVNLAPVAGADVTLIDLFYVALLGWWAMAALSRLTRRQEREPVAAFGQMAAVAFIAYAGLSLFHVALAEPGAIQDSTISWLRFAQTASIAWLAAIVIRTPAQLGVVLGGVVLGGLVLIGSAVVEFAGVGDLDGRYGGLLGPNVVGMMAGILVVGALFAPMGTGAKLGYRLPLIAVGAIGLLLGKSVGAFVATGLAIAIGVGFRGRGSSVERMGAVALALGVAIFFVIATVEFVRPTATPGSENFRESSTSQRVILGAAALEMFERDPVFGVGWRRSGSPSVIGSRELNLELRERFQGARLDFFPDVTTGSVHNTYLQILAETGLIGLALFATMLVLLGLGIKRLLGRLERGDPLRKIAWALALGLLLIFVWLNDNPLYGGQIETVLLAVLVGCVVAVSRMAQRRRPDAYSASRASATSPS